VTSPAVLMKAWKIYPKKQLGQNFLTDANMAAAIVAHGGVAVDDVVLEIGAGLGSLTLPLARQALKVIAVEKDHRLVELLRTELTAAGLDNVSLLEQDILKLDIPSLAKTEKTDLLVAGNVPYNISSQILVQILKARAHIKKSILMFQKELAQRITASPGSKSYGRLSVMVQYCAKVRVLTEVKAGLFYPKPNIDSLVLDIDFDPDAGKQVRDETFFFDVIKAAFSKRRKTLRNSLTGFIPGFDGNVSAKALEEAGINPVRRAETLTVEEFVCLSNHIFDAYL
jgi:16S rRNA (adenine1518-N6/adenine1519-N6)-dimethyltransferase